MLPQLSTLPDKIPMKKRLILVRSQLAFFQRIAAEYPGVAGYKSFVYDLQQQEADLASQIGRMPKGRPHSRRKNQGPAPRYRKCP